jgi:hypothetical protein
MVAPAVAAVPAGASSAGAVVENAQPWPDGDAADDEPALPEEAEARLAAEASAPTTPIAAEPGRVLNVRFGGAAPDRLIAAMQAFRQLIRERPGETRVVIHVPAPGGSALPMELRPVAYDAELLAEIRRRLGGELLDLSLA